MQQVKESKSNAWKQDLWDLIDMSAQTHQVPDVHLPEYIPVKAKATAPLSKVSPLNYIQYKCHEVKIFKVSNHFIYGSFSQKNILLQLHFMSSVSDK